MPPYAVWHRLPRLPREVERRERGERRRDGRTDDSGSDAESVESADGQGRWTCANCATRTDGELVSCARLGWLASRSCLAVVLYIHHAPRFCPNMSNRGVLGAVEAGLG